MSKKFVGVSPNKGCKKLPIARGVEPCPFCETPFPLVLRWQTCSTVFCQKCRTGGPSGKSNKKAIEKWNAAWTPLSPSSRDDEKAFRPTPLNERIVGKCLYWGLKDKPVIDAPNAKPCPFCRTPYPIIEREGSACSVVICERCEARGPRSKPDRKAIEKWNAARRSFGEMDADVG